MVFYYCDECGLRFKKAGRQPVCPRCKGTELMEEDIPASELTVAHEVVEEMIREQYEGGK